MTKRKKKKTELVIVTGLNGAGMTSVLKNLEDMNFEVFDNFPLTLVKSLLKDAAPRVAIGIDSRSRGFKAAAVLKAAKALNAKLVFITCDDNILHKRFTETRRKHPLAKDRPVRDGIRQERRMLFDLQVAADIVIDTSELSVHDLRHILEGYFASKKKSRMSVAVKSFAFRHGIPREADLVIDVRFLKNPHWVKQLKLKTGLDKKVGAYITTDPALKPFMNGFKKLLKPLLPRYAAEGKSYLTIAVGCSGGKHRSVYVAEQFRAWLKGAGYTAHTEHRDIKR
jgi:RNase adapter protein RapZ